MSTPHPDDVIWDITYACPLRCSHCYSESGRRRSRRLEDADMLRVIDRIIDLGPSSVAFAGGEPLLVGCLPQLARRLRDAGIAVAVYTSGWTMTADVAQRVLDAFDHVAVSVDGATPEVHDAIRGRAGGFQRAMRALRLLDQELTRTRRRAVRFGIDFVAVRSNFDDIDAMCRDVAPRFPSLGFLAFGAVAPAGLASRVGFAQHELLSDEQVGLLGSEPFAHRLRALAPPSVQVRTTDNLDLRHPGRSGAAGLMTIEADGDVRAMPVYEGTVGNILEEDPAELWARSVARRSDPFVLRTLEPARTMGQWAEATRRLDLRFGSTEVRERIGRRPPFVPVPTPGRPGQAGAA